MSMQGTTQAASGTGFVNQPNVNTTASAVNTAMQQQPSYNTMQQNYVQNPAPVQPVAGYVDINNPVCVGNATTVQGLIPQILQNMAAAGVIYPQEANIIQQDAATPMSINNIRNTVARQYGAVQLGFAQLQQIAQELVERSVRALRMRQQNMQPQGFGMPQQAYGYNNMYNNYANPYQNNYNNMYYNRPAMQYNNYHMNQNPYNTTNMYGNNVYGTGQQPQTIENEISSMYAMQQHANTNLPQDSLRSPFLQPSQRTASATMANAVPTTVCHAPAPKKAPADGKSLDIAVDLGQPPVVPKWSDAVTHDFGKKGVPTQYQAWTVEWEKKQLEVTDVYLPDPVVTQEGAVSDFLSLYPEAMDTKPKDDYFAHTLNYNKLILAEIPYEDSKELFDKCMKIIEDGQEDGKTSLTAIRHAMSEIKLFHRQDVAAYLMSVVLGLFNSAASINFSRLKDNNTLRRLDQITSFDDLDELLCNSGNPRYDEWKNCDKYFDKRLVDSLRDSFGALFAPGHKGYLDINEPKNVALILSCETLGFRASDGTPGRLLVGMPQDDARYAELKTYLQGVFPLLITRKLLLTNLPIKDITGKNIPGFDFGAFFLGTNPESIIMHQLIQTKGNLNILSMADSETLHHPLKIGETCDGSLIVRRVVPQM